MVSLVEVDFRKESKIRTMLSKINKRPETLTPLYTCILDELHPTFSQIACGLPYLFNAQVFGCSILQKRSWFEEKLGLVGETTYFLLFHGFLGVFEANSNNKRLLSLQNCLLEITGYLLSFLNHLMQGSTSKILQNFLKCEKT